MTTFRLGWGEGIATAWWMAAGIVPVAAYQAKGAASLAASYTNLANPGTSNAAPGTAPGWDAATGWQFVAASTQWLDTGLNPAPGTWSMFIQYTAAAAVVGCVAGAFAGGADRFYIYPNYPALGVIYGVSGSDTIVAPGLAAGNLGVAGPQGYRDGVADGAPAAAGTDPGLSIAIGAVRRPGGPQDHCTANISAVVVFNSTIVEIAALKAAMAAL